MPVNMGATPSFHDPRRVAISMLVIDAARFKELRSPGIVIPPRFGYDTGMETNWNQRYLEKQTPWDTNQPSSELQRVLQEYQIAPGRALDLGCGTGTNAVYLASRGFDVTGIDFAPTAIEAAKVRAASAGTNVRFLTGDAFKLPDLGPPFDFI